MAHVDNILGNILIKHNDKWRGDYYLKDDLTFSLNKLHAGRFYLLKPGDTTILNGDRVSIHLGNRTLIMDNLNILKLVDREQVQRELNSFIITNGTENTDPISYESPIFFISDKSRKTALRYEWGMDLISSNENSTLPEAMSYKPREHPNLINATYGSTCEIHINSFQFFLERADSPIRTVEAARTLTTSIATSTAISPIKKIGSDLFDGYKGAVLVILLMVILILCILASK